MKKRRLGQSDLFVSEVGLGCMSLGTDLNHAKRIIDCALEEGINYLDTADLYDAGVNEAIVGQALKSVRDKVIIATKVGNKLSENKNGWSWDPSKAYIKEAVKLSLKRLGTDYIDLYQLHGGTIEDPIEETIEAFEELRAEGYIRYYGISSIRPNVIREYVRKSNTVSVMMQYSILDRRPEEEALPLLQEHGISVVARGPIAKGILSDKGAEKISDGKGYLEYSHEELVDLLPAIREGLSGDRSMTEIALQYILANPVVASVITGASTPEQIIENARAVNSDPLTKEELEHIRKVSRANIYSQHR